MKRVFNWFYADSRRSLFFLLAASATLMLMLFSLTVRAADATLTWTNPTQYTDGSAIAPGALTQTSILYGKCNAGSNGLLATPAPVTVPVPQPATTKVITGLGAGSWCFAARAETAAEQSDFTAYVSKTIILKPAPPTGLTVTVLTAFMAVRQDDRYVMVPVGTVPAGTACDSNNGVIADGKSYYAVPFAQVSFYGATQPRVALATCA
jgi:hypothetical protein